MKSRPVRAARVSSCSGGVLRLECDERCDEYEVKTEVIASHVLDKDAAMVLHEILMNLFEVSRVSLKGHRWPVFFCLKVKTRRPHK